MAIQHSALSDGERHDQWQRIRRGDVDVVVGTRSAVFAPLTRLGVIIVDEEHDTSYKQEEAPRYHGRDVAIVRGRGEKALVVLGSATPSMESYQHALSGKYARATLERRVLDRPLASVRLVNMREEYADAGTGRRDLSRALATAIEDRLQRREQVLVLLNRRGYATAVFCRQCGDTFECPNCTISLTVHTARQGWRARCHYCNYSMMVPKTCRKCAAPYLEQAGFGTEKVEQQLRERFPAARIGRVDRDSVRRKGALDVASVALRGGRARRARRDADDREGARLSARDAGGRDLRGRRSRHGRFPRRRADLSAPHASGRAAQVAASGLERRSCRRSIPSTTASSSHAGRTIRHFSSARWRFAAACATRRCVAIVNVVVRGRSFDDAMQSGDRCRRSG